MPRPHLPRAEPAVRSSGLLPPARLRRRRSLGGRAALAGVVVFSALTLPACGYTFAARGGPLALAQGRAVQVEVFENRTTDGEAGILASRKVAETLAARGALTGSAPGAPLRLTGVVDRIRAEPAAVEVPQRVLLWRLEVSLRLALRDGPGPDAPVIARSSVSDAEEFLAGADIEATEVSRALAISRVMERLAEAAVDALAP